MQKKYGVLAKRVTINFLIVLVSIGGFTNSLCKEEKVEPGKSITCTLEITNYYPDKDGNVKAPDIIVGLTKANSDGYCPDPKLTWENQ